MASASAFSATKFTQPFSLNGTTSRSHEKHQSFFDPLRTAPSSSSFLGSTRKLRLSSASKSKLVANPNRRSAVVAVSDVVKEKKVKSTTNLVTNSTNNLSTISLIECFCFDFILVFILLLFAFLCTRD
jgi:pyruvate dehydrogenase E1 component alpha subunit